MEVRATLPDRREPFTDGLTDPGRTVTPDLDDGRIVVDGRRVIALRFTSLMPARENDGVETEAVRLGSEVASSGVTRLIGIRVKPPVVLPEREDTGARPM